MSNGDLPGPDEGYNRKLALCGEPPNCCVNLVEAEERGVSVKSTVWLVDELGTKRCEEITLTKVAEDGLESEQGCWSGTTGGDDVWGNPPCVVPTSWELRLCCEVSENPLDCGGSGTKFRLYWSDIEIQILECCCTRLGALGIYAEVPDTVLVRILDANSVPPSECGVADRTTAYFRIWIYVPDTEGDLCYSPSPLPPSQCRGLPEIQREVALGMSTDAVIAQSVPQQDFISELQLGATFDRNLGIFSPLTESLTLDAIFDADLLELTVSRLVADVQLGAIFDHKLVTTILAVEEVQLTQLFDVSGDFVGLIDWALHLQAKFESGTLAFEHPVDIAESLTLDAEFEVTRSSSDEIVAESLMDATFEATFARGGLTDEGLSLTDRFEVTYITQATSWSMRNVKLGALFDASVGLQPGIIQNVKLEDKFEVTYITRATSWSMRNVRLLDTFEATLSARAPYEDVLELGCQFEVAATYNVTSWSMRNVKLDAEFDAVVSGVDIITENVALDSQFDVGVVAADIIDENVSLNADFGVTYTTSATSWSMRNVKLGALFEADTQGTGSIFRNVALQSTFDAAARYNVTSWSMRNARLADTFECVLITVEGVDTSEEVILHDFFDATTVFQVTSWSMRNVKLGATFAVSTGTTQNLSEEVQLGDEFQSAMVTSATSWSMRNVRLDGEFTVRLRGRESLDFNVGLNAAFDADINAQRSGALVGELLLGTEFRVRVDYRVMFEREVALQADFEAVVLSPAETIPAGIKEDLTLPAVFRGIHTSQPSDIPASLTEELQLGRDMEGTVISEDCCPPAYCVRPTPLTLTVRVNPINDDSECCRHLTLDRSEVYCIQSWLADTCTWQSPWVNCGPQLSRRFTVHLRPGNRIVMVLEVQQQESTPIPYWEMRWEANAANAGVEFPFFCDLEEIEFQPLPGYPREGNCGQGPGLCADPPAWEQNNPCPTQNWQETTSTLNPQTEIPVIQEELRVLAEFDATVIDYVPPGCNLCTQNPAPDSISTQVFKLSGSFPTPNSCCAGLFDGSQFLTKGFAQCHWLAETTRQCEGTDWRLKKQEVLMLDDRLQGILTFDRPEPPGTGNDVVVTYELLGVSPPYDCQNTEYVLQFKEITGDSVDEPCVDDATSLPGGWERTEMHINPQGSGPS